MFKMYYPSAFLHHLFAAAPLVLAALLCSCKDEPAVPVDKKITSFVFPGNTEGVIDERAKTIAVLFPQHADITALQPVIGLSEHTIVMPGSGKTQDFSQPCTYTVIAADGSMQPYTVTVSCVKSSEARIRSFLLNTLQPPVAATVDPVAHRVTAMLPIGTDLTQLSPAIEVSERATVMPPSGEVRDFSQPAVYTVTAEDGTRQPYTVSLQLLPSDEKKILSFRIDSCIGVIHEYLLHKKILIELPYGTDLSLLTPDITVSEKARVSPAARIPQNFTVPVTYTVTADDTSTAGYTVIASTAPFSTRITGVSSDTLLPGTAFTIAGVFTGSGSKATLKTERNGQAVISELPVAAESKTHITATVPLTVAEGTYTLTVTSGGIPATAAQPVAVAPLDPVITAVTPTDVLSGGSLTIAGLHFAGSGNRVHLLGEHATCTHITIFSESPTEVACGLPPGITEGTYTVLLHTGKKSTTFAQPITVMDPTLPRLLSLDKSEIIRGPDGLEITGINLGTNACSAFFRRKGETRTQSYTVYATNNTHVTVREFVFANYPAFFILDTPFEMWLRVQNKNTNIVTFTLRAHDRPQPVISAVSDLSPCRGSTVTITGSHFADDAEVQLEYTHWNRCATPHIVSRTATEIVFATNKLAPHDSFKAIIVLSAGQEGRYPAEFGVRECE